MEKNCIKGEHMNSETTAEIIRLNIVMTYPVRWSAFKIASNFVQNFYDVLGSIGFADGFKYDYKDQQLTMMSKGTFSKEWLLYLGTSTKRNSKNAGGFGEGFKLAALNSIRDYNMTVVMESADWTLRVTSVPGRIDNREVEFLAYEVGKRPYQDNSVLRLGNVTDLFVGEFESALSSFYYPENVLFGKCLTETEDYAVYVANQMPEEHYCFGYLFASYERRADFRIPLIICDHSYRPDEDDRDRDSFTNAQTVRCVGNVFQQLDSATSMQILEYFQSCWGGRKDPGYHKIDWTPVIRILIRNMGRDNDIAVLFRQRYRESLVFRDTATDERNPNKRKMAMLWFQQASVRGQFRFVLPAFRQLGIRSVCQLCEEMDGYTTEREPDDTEGHRISVLKMAAQEVLNDLLLLKKWPDCKILLNPKAPIAGLTRIKKADRKRNPYGLKVIARADHVYLQSYLLQDGRFAEAFTTYSHELLHQYGGDSSLQFHNALLIMNKKILQSIDQFESFEKEWEQVGLRGKE